MVPVLWVAWHATTVQHRSASNSSICCWPGTRALCPILCRQNPALGQELLGNPVPPFRPFSLKPCPHAPATPAAPAQWDWLELHWPTLWSSRKLSEAEGGTDVELTSGPALEDHSLGGLLPTPDICICVLPRVTGLWREDKSLCRRVQGSSYPDGHRLQLGDKGWAHGEGGISDLSVLVGTELSCQGRGEPV